MSLFEELRDLGVNVDEGLERVMGDEPLYEMMLGMFIDSVISNPIEIADFDAEDLESLTKHVHALKGVTGNLSMTPLFTGYVKMLELLRGGRPEEAREEYERILPARDAILDCIKRHSSM